MSIQDLPSIISNTIEKFKECDWNKTGQKHQATLSLSENEDLYNLTGLVFQVGIRTLANKEIHYEEEDSDKTMTLYIADNLSKTACLDELEKACQVFIKFLGSNWKKSSSPNGINLRSSKPAEHMFLTKSTELENERAPFNSSKKMDKSLAACLRTASRVLGISTMVYTNQGTPSLPEGKVFMAIHKKDFETLHAFFNFPKTFPSLLDIALKIVVKNTEGNDAGLDLLPVELQERVRSASQLYLS